jgi:hypothetical protein
VSVLPVHVAPRQQVTQARHDSLGSTNGRKVQPAHRDQR